MKFLSLAPMTALAGFLHLVSAVWDDPLLECPSQSRFLTSSIMNMVHDAKASNILPSHPSYSEEIDAALEFSRKIRDGSMGKFLMQVVEPPQCVRLFEWGNEQWNECGVSTIP
ncbi:CSEP0339 putative effector protein [Blumeria hordei DH14]|uniref:CSEP0339 putative effector protein n=1 Tax=Blumeria graminis f. sp. hordei (strain DH14) TaxID=546991 RepID=N1J8Q4_BLUG1|nr:CSEP0339 putative effector protein [Blumeria hordei DH14]